MKVKTFDEIEIVISNEDLLALMCRARQADKLHQEKMRHEKNIIGLRYDIRQKDEALIKRNAELKKFHAEGGAPALPTAMLNGHAGRVTLPDGDVERSRETHDPTVGDGRGERPARPCDEIAADGLARSVDRMVLNLRRIHDMAQDALDEYCVNTQSVERYILLSNAISQIREFVVFEATGEVFRQSLMFKLQEQFKEAKGGEA